MTAPSRRGSWRGSVMFSEDVYWGNLSLGSCLGLSLWCVRDAGSRTRPRTPLLSMTTRWLWLDFFEKVAEGRAGLNRSQLVPLNALHELLPFLLLLFLFRHVFWVDFLDDLLVIRCGIPEIQMRAMARPVPTEFSLILLFCPNNRRHQLRKKIIPFVERADKCFFPILFATKLKMLRHTRKRYRSCGARTIGRSKGRVFVRVLRGMLGGTGTLGRDDVLGLLPLDYFIIGPAALKAFTDGGGGNVLKFGQT